MLTVRQIELIEAYEEYIRVLESFILTLHAVPATKLAVLERAAQKLEEIKGVK